MALIHCLIVWLLTIKRCGPLSLAHTERPAQRPEHQPPGTAGGHVLHQEVNLPWFSYYVSYLKYWQDKWLVSSLPIDTNQWVGHWHLPHFWENTSLTQAKRCLSTLGNICVNLRFSLSLFKPALWKLGVYRPASRQHHHSFIILLINEYNFVGNKKPVNVDWGSLIPKKRWILNLIIFYESLRMCVWPGRVFPRVENSQRWGHGPLTHNNHDREKYGTENK